MINKTLDFYNNNSKTYIEKTLSGDTSNLYKDFLNNIPKFGSIWYPLLQYKLNYGVFDNLKKSVNYDENKLLEIN